MAGPTIGFTASDNEPWRPTYGAGVLGLVVVNSPTDYFEIANPTGSGKVVRIKNITIGGYAGSAVTLAVRAVRRSTANTSGTSSSITPGKHDANDAASVCTVKSYTANPTTGTLADVIHTGRLVLVTSGNLADWLCWDFSWENDKAIVIRPGETFAINGNGAGTYSSPAVDIDIRWSEEDLQLTSYPLTSPATP